MTPYREYSAQLTQGGANAPEPTARKNELGGEVVWSRTGPGEYLGTLAGAFPAGATIFPHGHIQILAPPTGENVLMSVERFNDDSVLVRTTFAATGTGTDDYFRAFLEIRVYCDPA